MHTVFEIKKNMWKKSTNKIKKKTKNYHEWLYKKIYNIIQEVSKSKMGLIKIKSSIYF
jgi:hypothetical protein